VMTCTTTAHTWRSRARAQIQFVLAALPAIGVGLLMYAPR
jgi:hypothetical protein